MIQAIIRFSAHNRFLVLLATAVVVAYGIYTLQHIPVDAIPDLSDTQVIIYSRWDRSPDIIEDQVTYPIVSALLGTPNVKTIRGFSDFGFSYVYVIFQDGTDIYWARSRVLEYLSKIQPLLPNGVTTEIGPDATGVGWVFQYALVDDSGTQSLADLRTLQDWNLRYRLQSVPGVAEVASIGGFVQQYQVTVDPTRLKAYDLAVMDVSNAVRTSNSEVGGRLLELAGKEFMVRGRGYVKSRADLEQIVLKTDQQGTPVLLRDVATVAMGPEMRRGIADLDGTGEAVGGIIVMRHAENARDVIGRVKVRLKELEASLPKGVRIVTTYDRSELIAESIANLRHELITEIAIVSLVILLFLWHIPSAIVPIITIPVSVLLAFIPMRMMGISSNIMSLAGIAISIGVLVDGAIVEVENAYKKLELWQEGGRQGDYHAVRLQALLEVGPSVFFSLLVIAVAFLPIFTLVDQEGRLFTPLAWTKNLALFIAAILAVTLDPALRMLFTRMDFPTWRPRFLSWLVGQVTVGRYYAEEKHPISRILFWIYEPACRAVLRFPKATIVTAVLIVVSTIPIYQKLGHEFMPALNEGTILYMPTTLPGISVTEAGRLLQTQDRILKSFPEVVSVFGKAGRAETSTDPAPFSMMETTVVLKPPSEWRPKPRWYSGKTPEWLQALVLRRIWADRISWTELTSEMDAALKIPGTTNAWTMPIKARIDMLTTGIRTPVGIKVFGADLKQIEAIGTRLEEILRAVPGTRSVFAERAAGGYFVDFDLNREALARYGLSVGAVQDVIMSAVGGENVTTTIEGRAQVPGQCPLPARPARRSRSSRPGVGDDAVGRADPVVAGGRHPHPDRPVHDPQRERAARGLRVRGHDRQRRGRLRGARPRRGRRGPDAAQRLFARVERPVREHAARARTAQGGRPDHAVPDLLPALHEHEVRLQGLDRDAGRALLGGGRRVAHVRARLQRVDRGVGGHDRADGARRRNRRLHAAVPRSVVRGGACRGAAGHADGPARGHHPRRRQTGSAEDDDRRSRHDGPDADHVVDGHGRRRHEARGGTDGRRARHVVRDGVARVSGHLPAVEAAGAAARASAACSWVGASYSTGTAVESDYVLGHQAHRVLLRPPAARLRGSLPASPRPQRGCRDRGP